jgi:hypothetical protein
VLALDRLIGEIGSCAGDYRKLSPELLRVAGDNAAICRLLINAGTCEFH